MNPPDVTVIVAVYNTMPYLTRCLLSLERQSIGPDRMEIIAVDDGSTDNSGRELDRFARRYPKIFTVIHQDNSGGPARPSNRALDQAKGRYVFFIGADDYLGSEALERLVAAADQYGSDVVLGRAVGVNSRYVHQAIYARNETDVDLFDSALPYSMANTKLFRRELIERYGLRYPEDMPVASDQPFTLEACLRARRISVLADYDFYYAVRRLNAHNITYRSRHVERLHSIESVMDFAAGLIEPGKQRDAILVRHFNWEISKLLEDDLLRLEPDVQEQVHAGVRRLAEAYLTDNIIDQLGIETRLRLSIARHGDLADLLDVIRTDAHGQVPPTVIEAGRWYAAYPGFRDTESARPDSWFDVTAGAADWLAKLDATSVRWERDAAGDRILTITAHSPVPDLSVLCTEPPVMTAGDVAGETVVLAAPAGGGTSVRARFRVETLLAGAAPLGGRRSIRTSLRVSGAMGSAQLRAPRVPRAAPMICRRGSRLYLITPTKDHSGQFMIAISPVTMSRVVARLRRTRLQGGK